MSRRKVLAMIVVVVMLLSTPTDGRGKKKRRRTNPKPKPGTETNRYDVESREGTHWPSERKIQEAEQMINEGKYREAIPILKSGLKTLPRHAQAAFLIGLAHANLAESGAGEEHYRSAERYYLRAVKEGTDSARFANFATVAHSNVGNIAQARGDLGTAAKHFEAAIERKMEGLFEPIRSLGMVYEKQGLIAKAKAAFADSLAMHREDALRLHMTDILPLVYPSQAALEDAAQEYVAGMEGLLRQQKKDAPGLVIPNPLKELFSVPHYYLAYHGVNYADLIGDIGTIVARSSPGVKYTAPHLLGKTRSSVLAAQSKGRSRIRVGFVCMFFRSHSVGKFIAGTIVGLDPSEFEVVIFATREPYATVSDSDVIRKRIKDRADRWYDLPKVTIDKLRAPIVKEQLDILVFVEVGMDPGNYILGMSRLAPIQIATHGHASTTGLPLMDYFVSYHPFELPSSGAQENYVEPLVTLPDFLFYYPPNLPPAIPSRTDLFAQLGLSASIPKDAHVYACPQTQFKLTPDFDAVFKAILEGDPQGVLLLKTYASPELDAIISTRLTSSLGPHLMDRVVILPVLSGPQWFGVLQASDLILDSYPFGGYTTTLEALYMGTPVLTLQHPFLMSGRCTSGFLSILGLDDVLSVTSRQDYIDTAVHLGTNTDGSLDAIRSRVVSVKDQIYQRTRATRAWERLFRETVEGNIPTDLHIAKHPSDSHPISNYHANPDHVFKDFVP